MEQRAVVDLVKLRVIRRQNISEENHISRIRSATAIRMSDNTLLPGALEVIPVKYLHLNQDPNYFRGRKKSHQNCVATEFWGEYSKNKPRQSFPSIHRITGDRRKFSTVPMGGNINRHFLGDIEFNFKDELKYALDDEEILIPKNPFSSVDDENSFEQESSKLFDDKEFFQSEDPYSSEGSKIELSRNVGEMSDDEEVFMLNSPFSSKDIASDNDDEFKKTCANDLSCLPKVIHPSLDNKSDFENELQEKTSEDKEIFKSKSPHFSGDSKSEFESNLQKEDGKILPLKCPYSSKDIIILKWLHERSNPLSMEEKCASNEKSLESTLQAEKKITYPTAQQVFKEVVDIASSAGEETGVSKEKIFSINPEEQRKEIDSSEELAKHVPNVEIRVLETGKLQISFDSNIILAEDAAIVIWIEDIPEKLFVQECDMHLSIPPESSVKQTEYPAEVTGSLPESELEKVPVSKSDSNLPLTTNNSHKAVNSKFKMKSLSVLYKRSDLAHIFSHPSNQDRKCQNNKC